ncbi:MAG: NifB/NifX family molybdenum-iron cluster-binding protein [Deltaproteobacteria bacterium]|nr:NifB/NifX family molybdenum-iron cluster-binding protein [Deltaproteobacteria bacterium]
MKIAISASGSTMEAMVDPRFGRCQYFIIVDPETGEFEALANEFQGAAGGAGTQAGQLMASKGVQAVLTGNCGPNAFAVLQDAGIQVITGVSGTVSEVVERYRQGGYQSVAAPTVEAHAGMNQAPPPPGAGMGPGMGRGLGMGRRGGGGGRGCRGGGGRGMGGGRGRG